MPTERAEVVTVGEWSQFDLPGVALTLADRRLCSRLKEQGRRRLRVEETASGLWVETTSWVGLVRFSFAQVHVVPKFAGEYVGLIRLLEWLAGLEELADLGSDPEIELGGDHLLDLVALLLVREVERVLRRGVRSDYTVQEEALGVLRGRFLFERQLRKRPERLDKLECRYDERSADIFDNQLLLAAIERCSARAVHVNIRRRASRVRSRLAQICDAQGIALPRHAISYDRLNGHYRQAHELAWLVLEGTEGLDDLYASGDTRSFAFLLDMSRLFERFVERVMELAATACGAQVFFQRPSGSVVRRAESGRTYSRLIPDVLLRSNDPPATLPIDAKYKRYSERKVDPADIAQAFLYATSLGSRPKGGPPSALIAYPAESSDLERLPLTVRRAHGGELAAVTALGIPIPRVLDEVDLEEQGMVVQGVAESISKLIASPVGA
jgi:5-methylcytosine-specific restriction enzyme subunit McrC